MKVSLYKFQSKFPTSKNKLKYWILDKRSSCVSNHLSCPPSPPPFSILSRHLQETGSRCSFRCEKENFFASSLPFFSGAYGEKRKGKWCDGALARCWRQNLAASEAAGRVDACNGINKDEGSTSVLSCSSLCRVLPEDLFIYLLILSFFFLSFSVILLLPINL